MTGACPHSLLPIFWQFSSTYQPFLSSLAGITSRLSRKARQVTRCYVSRQTCHLFPTSHSECLARKKKNRTTICVDAACPPPKIQVMPVPPNIRILRNLMKKYSVIAQKAKHASTVRREKTGKERSIESRRTKGDRGC